MPVYRIHIIKRWVPLQYEYSNVYYVNTGTLQDGAGYAQSIALVEQALHLSDIAFDRYRVSTLPENDDLYVTGLLGFQGNRQANWVTGDPLAIHNVVLVKMLTAIGRPSLKYYRGILREGDVRVHEIDQGVRDLVTNTLNTLLTNQVPLCQEDGTPIVGILTAPNVGSRQLRRGSRRRTRGLPL